MWNESIHHLDSLSAYWKKKKNLFNRYEDIIQDSPEQYHVSIIQFLSEQSHGNVHTMCNK